jgi:hypothetical protein
MEKQSKPECLVTTRRLNLALSRLRPTALDNRNVRHVNQPELRHHGRPCGSIPSLEIVKDLSEAADENGARPRTR